MEQTLSSISPAEFYARLRTAAAPTFLDVRRRDDFAAATLLTRVVIEIGIGPGGTTDNVVNVVCANEGEGYYCNSKLSVIGINNPARDLLAVVVRGADSSRHELPSVCAGIFAVSLGESGTF